MIDAKRASSTKTIWVTKQGERIPVKKMETSHLLNTVLFLWSKGGIAKHAAELSLYEAECFLQGEMALESINSAQMQLMNMTLSDFIEDHVPTWPALVKEAKRRKLKLPEDI